MAQIRGTAGYNLGHSNPFVGPGRADATGDPSPLDAIREQTSKIEDWLETASDPVKPYVPSCVCVLLLGWSSLTNRKSGSLL
jgi:ER-derived vesicles protein